MPKYASLKMCKKFAKHGKYFQNHAKKSGASLGRKNAKKTQKNQTLFKTI